MNNIQEYRNAIIRIHRSREEAEVVIIKEINEWHEMKWITYSQKEHLLKFNKMLSK